MNMAGKARRAGRACMGLLLGALGLVLLLHAFILLVEAPALAALTVAAVTLVLPGRWRTIRRQMAAWGSHMAAEAAAWGGAGLNGQARASGAEPDGTAESCQGAPADTSGEPSFQNVPSDATTRSQAFRARAEGDAGRGAGKAAMPVEERETSRA